MVKTTSDGVGAGGLWEGKAPLQNTEGRGYLGRLDRAGEGVLAAHGSKVATHSSIAKGRQGEGWDSEG